MINNLQVKSSFKYSSSSSLRNNSNNILKTMISILPPSNNIERLPIDICCVIDISGSMESLAPAPSQGIESCSLSVLDIVKHSVKTIITCLKDGDRLAIVSYSTYARIELELTNMNEEGKNIALEVLSRLRIEGSTNIWDGLLKGMETMSKRDSFERNSAIFLLTDGCPNVDPPKTYKESMRDYKDSHGGVYPATISTFGFGYSMESGILNEIALEGDGSYAFIPDSGFVGTIFVNALANQLSSFAKQSTLSIELNDGVEIIPESLLSTCPGASITSWGVILQIGNLQYDQRRDFTFDLKVNSNQSNQNSFFQATLEFQPVSTSLSTNQQTKRITINCENSIHPATNIDLLVLESNLFRSEVIDRTIISSTSDHYRIVGNIDEYSQDLSNEMKSWCSRVESRYSDISQEDIKKLKDYVEALNIDLTGEINLASENSSNYEKWGKHFLPSIRRAHQLQQCNNFKDPGVQFYGGPLFNLLRDEAEDMFCTLPAPVSSRPVSYSTSSYSYYSNSTPYDMSAYMNASAGCISGECKVLLSDGSVKLMKEIIKGDKVCCNLSYNNPNKRKYEAIVECVVRTKCMNNKVEMVTFPSGLIATPWHPVYLLTNQNNSLSNLSELETEIGKWIFPFEYIGESQLLSEEYVYNLVLGSITSIDNENENNENNEDNKVNRGQSFIVNGMECISLAHGIINDKVAEHEFYGTEKAVESLQSLIGINSYYKTGLVTIDSSQIIRDPITGLVCNYQHQQQQESQS